MKIKSSFIITPSSITLVYNGKPYTMLNSNASFKVVYGLLKKGKESDAVNYFDIPGAIKNYIKTGVEIKNGVIFYNGEELKNSLTERIIGFMRDGLNAKPLIKFLEKLYKNMEPLVRERLFNFLENKHIPITQDGNFIGYKSVTADYLDWHTKTVPNHVGTTNTIPPEKVNQDPHAACASNSYHVGNYAYAKRFNDSVGRRIVLCEVNPEKVLCVPDYDHDKIRVSQYTVVDEMIDQNTPLSANKYSVQKDKKGLVNYHNKRGPGGRFIKRK